MKKLSKIQARINEARLQKRQEAAQTRPVWDEFHRTYLNCCEGKDKILSATMGAIQDLTEANEKQPLLTDLDMFELQGALKLLDADYAHYTEQLEGIYSLHAGKYGGLSMNTEEQGRVEAKLALEVSERYMALEKFFRGLITADNNVIFSVLYRYETRQKEQNAHLEQEAIPA